jgi:peptidoglycan/LPS O-acetylase OafA/YrhL
VNCLRFQDNYLTRQEWSTDLNQAEPRVFGLDMMRAMAIVLVLISHSRHFIIKDFPIVDTFKLGGFYGVEIFFVLSGFLIGSILLKLSEQLGETNGLFYFWKRRWYRTLPNYYLFLVLNMIVSVILSKPLPKLWLFLPFLQNFAWEQAPFFAESWSLAVEEWFYLLLPVGLYLLSKTQISFRRSFLLLCLFFLFVPTVLRLAHVLTSNPLWDQGVRKVTILRLDSIMFGMLAAWVKLEWPENWGRLAKPLLLFGVILVLSASFIFFNSSLDQSNFCRTWLFTVVSLGFASFIPFCDCWAIQRESFVTGLVRKIALWSYSLYLCNLMVLLVIRGFVSQANIVYRLFSYVIFFVTCLGISSIIYYYFEKPMMALRER